MLFDSQAKGLMNKVTDAMRAIDSMVWIRAALTGADSRPIVFDSMRFADDYRYFRENRFYLVKVTAPLVNRLARLRSRGQEFDPDVDDDHAAEAELDRFEFDGEICNGGDTDHLNEQVLQTIASLGI
jgi:hypothetical protein